MSEKPIKDINPSEQEKTTQSVTRREALSFLFNAAVVVPALGLVATEKQKIQTPEEIPSEWFNYAVGEYSNEYKKELERIVEDASLETKNDREQRPRMKYIVEALEVKGVSEVIQTELKRLFPALAVVESRYKEDAKSEDGARGILQILTIVWSELATADMNPWSLVDQVTVASKYLSQLHRHLYNECSDEIEAIKNAFFDGDVAQFEKEFVTPVMINGYFSGMGTMATLVNWFHDTYKTKEDTIEEIEQAGILSGYDIYYLLSRTAFHQVPVERYKEKAMDYALRVYGARKMLDENLDETTKARLL